MPSIPRPNKSTLYVEIDPILKLKLVEFAVERGSTPTREVQAAIRRHLANPPPREQDAPLPGTPRPRKRAAKKS